MLRVIPSRWLTVIVITASAAAPHASCTDVGARHNEAPQVEVIGSSAGPMLEAIYAGQKPVRFEQLDVSDTVSWHFPAGTTRTQVLETFAKTPTSKVIENSAKTLIVRDNNGQAMLDPDARSIVMTFAFDAQDRVVHIDAIHMRNQ